MRSLFIKHYSWLSGRTFFWDLAKKIGAYGAWIYIKTAPLHESVKLIPYRLWSRGFRYPLWCRPQSSDRAVFNQVFIEGQYAGIPLRGDERLILDCGANVGYSSVYFLLRCPHAQVIAVEPDPDNYSMLARHLKPYGKRVAAIQAAVWPSCTHLRMVLGLSGWEARVEETSEVGGGAVVALDLPSILAAFPGQCVDLLKVDIEGAEVQLFGENTEAWIDRVNMCAAELHGPECENAFHKLFKEDKFECFVQGELTIAVRRR